MATWKKVIVSGSNISQLNNDSLFIHTGSNGVALSGSFSGSFQGDGSGLTGVTAAGTLSSSAQIADDISGSLSAAHLNSKVPGLLSSSAQIGSDISGSFTDVSSSIATDIASLDSSKADKTAVTGAFADASSSIATDIDALQSDSGSFSTRVSDLETFSSSLDATFATEAEVNTATSSLSSSLAADIATNLSSINTLEGKTLVSGSAQIASDISGSFVNASSSIATDIDALQSDSGSFSTRVTTLEAFSSSLDATFATEAEVNTATSSLSASLAIDIAQNKSDLENLTSGELNSGSFNVTLKHDTGSIAFTEGLEIGDVYDQGNGTTDIRVPNGASWLELNYADSDFIYLDGTDAGINLDNTYEWKFFGATGTMTAPGEIRTSGTISGSKFVLTGGQLLSGSAQLNTITGVAAAISGAFGADSGSFSTRVTSLEGSVGAGGLLSSSAQIADDISGSFTLTSASIATDIATNVTDISALQTFSQSFDTAFNLSGQNVTVTGNLTVAGTTTTVDSTTVDIGDNIIALNGTGATKGGLAVNDGPASGSLLWDGTNDYWVAGPTGSETKIFTAGGNDGLLSGSAQIADDISGSLSATAIAALGAGILSGSAQIASNISGSFVQASGSIATDINALQSDSGSFSTRVTDLETFSSSLDNTFVTETELNTASSSLSSSLASDIATNVTDIAALESFSSSLSSTVIAYTGSFAGDGSGLSGITVDQNATVTASFSNAATASVTHNFDSDNILVVVYDDQNEQFIPQTIKAVSADVVEIHFTPNATGRAIVARGGHIVSGSIPYENLLNVPANIVSGSGQILVVTTGTGVLSGSAQIASDISGSFVQASSSIATDIDALQTDSGSFSTRVTSLESSVGAGGLLSSSAQIASDISGSFVQASSSIATDINALQSFSSSVDGALSISGQNVTVKGDLTVAGTTTTVNSTTLDIGDNIISLNGTGATNGGIEVNDGPASGSLLWDGTADYWKAGAKGSESKIFTAGGNDGLLSSSAQIATNISGAFAAASSSIATEIDALQASVGGGGLLSSSAQIASDISGSFTDASSSIAADIATNLSSINTLEGKTLVSSSAQIATDISGSFTLTSASIATDIASLDSSKADKTAVTGAFAQASASIATEIDALQASVGGGGLLSSSAQIADDISGSFGTVSSSLASRIVSNDADIAGLNTYSSSLKTALTVSGQNVTVVGNLTVSGTTTTVNSTTVDIGDNIIALNGTGATKGGLAVNDGPDSGSLLWDGTNNYWIAGPSGSETKVFVAGATGDGLLSGSAQIADNISGSFTDVSASIATDIAALDSGKADKTAVTGAFAQASGSFSTRVTSLEASVGAGGLLSSSAQIADDISGSLGTNATLIRSLTAATISGSFTLTSASIATDIAGLDSSKADKTAVSGAFTLTSSSIASDIAGLVVDSGSFSTRVTDLETFSSSLDATFATEAEVNAATSSLSSSLAIDIAQNATDISSNLALINALQGQTLISQSVLSSNGQGQAVLTNNGVAGSTVDLGLQTTDSPTFAGLTVTGDLVVTGNTVEAQVTNLNVEDKYILLNSGSTSGDSGIVFGGADGVANSGVGLFWDSSYNSNDGRLGIVNSIAAGATGDQTPSYHIAGVFEGTEANAATAQADHVGNIRVDGGEIYIYV